MNVNGLGPRANASLSQRQPATRNRSAAGIALATTMHSQRETTPEPPTHSDDTPNVEEALFCCLVLQIERNRGIRLADLAPRCRAWITPVEVVKLIDRLAAVKLVRITPTIEGPTLDICPPPAKDGRGYLSAMASPHLDGKRKEAA